MPARVAELADATDLKSVGLTSVPVRVRPRAPQGGAAWCGTVQN